MALGIASLAASEAAAWQAFEAARQLTDLRPATVAVYMWAARAPLACGDLSAAGVWADEVVALTEGCDLAAALATRARVRIARGEPGAAARDAHDALAITERVRSHLLVPDILECLAELASDTGSHYEAVRLVAAADAVRQRIGAVRFGIHEATHRELLSELRTMLGDNDFDDAWVQGAQLSTEEASGYAQRGRGERKRPSTGWDSLTPAELDVVRLVGAGLGNKDIGARLFVSPRTVQAHLTHVYTKLGLTSRIQLIQEAARHL